MIELKCEQGSPEWIEARLGIPTASEFSRIVTPGGKPSAGQEAYMCELLAETFLQEPVTEFGGSFATERGRILEPKARKFYAFHRDADPRLAGFVYRDVDRQVGCSPDWLIDPDGCGEIKCPSPGKHLLWLSHGEIPRDHIMQVQGQLWVTSRAWCDFLSFHPTLPPLIVRAFPNAELHKIFDAEIPAFIEELNERKDALRERLDGYVPERLAEREFALIDN